jgi:ethanolamine utilization protein EutJ
LSRPELLQTLETAERVIRWMPDGRDPDRDGASPLPHVPEGPLSVGADLGTAYLVLVVVDRDGQPIAGEYQFAQVARDGLVVDFVGAVDRLTAMKRRVEQRLGRELSHASSAYPPGVPAAEVRATANVVEAAGLHCTGLVDEPSAANALLRLENGVIVDVGGGTTGIAILRDGRVEYTADEPTGGTHFSLVIAGAHNIDFEAAEAMKLDSAQQDRLYPIIRPVMEKVADIVRRHVLTYQARHGHAPDQAVLVGGTARFPGLAAVVEEYTGIPTRTPEHPLFVTPLGIALHDLAAQPSGAGV